MTSLSQVFITKATRTFSPFQHGILKVSEHKRKLDRSVIDLPATAGMARQQTAGN
jgi:hypothetical protein